MMLFDDIHDRGCSFPTLARDVILVMFVQPWPWLASGEPRGSSVHVFFFIVFYCMFRLDSLLTAGLGPTLISLHVYLC